MTLTRRAVKRKPTTEDVLSQVEMSLEKRDELIKDGEENINIPNIMDPRYRQGGTGFINFCNHFVRVPIYRKGDTQPTWTPLKDLPDEEWRPGVSYKTFWEKQCNIARKALKMKDGHFIYRIIILCWQRGEGKCLRQGTEIITCSGKVKKVEDVKVGDLLMGDDNTPRKVLSLASGREEMFEVIPNRGESFTVTGDHKLSLKRSESSLFRRGKYISDYENKQYVDITVNDFQKQSNFFKNNHFLYQVPIDWSEQEVPIDPYFLGAWLADGNSINQGITTADFEVVDYLHKYAAELGLKVTNHPSSPLLYRISNNGGGVSNVLLDALRESSLIGNKHIPQVYKSNSREVRLKLLAGIIDGDGYLNRNSFQLTLKSKTLSEDIAFVARSLGFHVEVKKCTKGIKSTGFLGTYYRIGISGDCSVIPTIVERRKASKRSDWKDILVTGIKEIRSVGEQDYYGFMLNGNHRFLLSDFTVTHNSVMAVLIQIWKFFCFRAQTIVLGANSRDQIKFVHFDIIRDIIINSPLLLYIVEGRKNVKEKEIRRYFRGEDEQRYNSIRAITTSTGIVSNITGYTFSEIFDMKNPKFFYQLDGSIRNIPNALGVIDSTVSAKDHALYDLYEIFTEKKDPTVFFSYRYSLKGQAEDYWNPQMDQKQLDAYRVKFPPAEYAQYFTNLWSSGTIRMFSPEQVLSLYYLKTVLGEGHVKLLSVLRERLDLKDYTEQMEKDNSNELSIDVINDNYKKIRSIEKSLVPVSNLYNIEERYGICTLEDLNILSKEYETDFVILAGFDRSDPMAIHGARSIFSLIAKGCVGSQKMGFSYTDVNALEYIYFLIGLDVVEPNTLKQMKDIIIRCNDEFDDVDSVCTERWGMFDFMEWCEENQFPNEAIQPSYNRQRTFFGELYTAIAKGNFKSPFINIPGSRGIDILKEELEIFMQDEKSKWFGSPEKNSRNGIQDDVIYSIGLAMYGGLTLTVDDFRIRHMKSPGFMFVQEKQVYGKY